MSERTDIHEIPEVVVDEQRQLEKVHAHLSKTGGRSARSFDYDEELIALRDEIAEARAKDMPPLVEQMTRLQALAAMRGLGEDQPVDPASPYFGHLRLKEEEGVRDVLLGKRTYLSTESDVRIVDWRNAPVSRMYYSYDEGDDYEEEFGGKMRQGRVLARRSVTITDAELKRVASSEITFSKRGGRWIALDPQSSMLSGGQGISLRAEGFKPVRGTLGVDADGTDRKDKHLPEIASLLDRRQFELISAPSSGLLVVQGSAGSGKTTVGLHRLAYLVFQDPRRFRADRSMIVVFNDALVSYISRVLPALGVNGVSVRTFARWAGELRKKHVPKLPTRYADGAPSVIARLKKHPAMLSILSDIVDVQDERETEKLFDVVSQTPDAQRVRTAWNTLLRLPLEARRRRVLKWLDAEVRIGRDRSDDLHQRTVFAAQSALGRMEKRVNDVVSDWADLFTDRQALQNAFDTHAPAEFTDAELDQTHAWCVACYGSLDSEDSETSPCIDREDEAILLRLYQLKVGWLRGRGGRIAFDHLMVDEVQDFSPLEIAVLMEATSDRRSVTLAGDPAQRIVYGSGFTNWDDLLGDLGVSGTKVEPLKVAYRSTVEIMKLAQDVLGPLAKEAPMATRHGAPVEWHNFSDPGQAVGFIGEALRDLSAREPMANVAIISRHLAQARDYYNGLRKAEVPRLRLVVDEDFSFRPGVEVTEARQVKGLEFDYVILVDVNADSYPSTDESRHFLHVGVTRAAHQLWVISTGRPSPILPAWLLGE